MKCYAIDNYLNADSVEQREKRRCPASETFKLIHRLMQGRKGESKTVIKSHLLF